LKSTLQFILLFVIYNIQLQKALLKWGQMFFSKNKKSGDRCFMVTGVSNTEAKEE
jgi:hypothetical protein